MSLVAVDTGGGDFELCPAGNHVARCYAVVDLGIQKYEWSGEIKHVHKVRISWELPTELMDDGRPFSISQNYTLSLGEKANLRRDLQSWRGRAFTAEELQGFDLFTVLGVPGLVNVVHKPSKDGTKTYANIGAISPLPKGMECPPEVNEQLKFSVADGEGYDALPDWLKQKINLEVPAPTNVTSQSTDFESFDDPDIPF